MEDVHAFAVQLDLGAPGGGELLLHFDELPAHHLAQAVRIDQDLEQSADAAEERVELLDDLLLLEPGQAVQAKIEYRLGLRRAHAVHVPGGPLHESESVGQIVGFRGVGTGAIEHVPHRPGRPVAFDEALLRLGGIGGCPDERDHRIDVRQRDREPLQDVRPLSRLSKLEDGPPRHHLAPVAHERLDHLPDAEQPGLPVDQRDEVDAEHRLHRGELVQVVQHDLGVLAAPQLDDDPHAVLVGLVAQGRDALDALLLHELRDLLQQPRLVDLVRKLADDDSFAGTALDRFEAGPRADVDPPAPGAVRLVDPGRSIDDSRGRESPVPA